VIPNGERTSLRFLIPEITAKTCDFQNHDLHMLCSSLVDKSTDALTATEARLFGVFHNKGLLRAEKNLIKLGVYWKQERHVREPFMVRTGKEEETT
jgi:hypothetical protein